MVSRVIPIIVFVLVAVVNAQRAVFPLIVDGIAPNGARVSDPGVNNDQPGKGSSSISKESLFVLSPNSQYVKSSGGAKSCRQHSDCYGLREPDEWCTGSTGYQIFDKGCFCDPSRGQCAIERKGSGGSEYTDCTDKSQSKCSRGGLGIADIQFADVSGNSAANSIETIRLGPKSKSLESGKGFFSLSPQSNYVKTSADPKSCKIHDDCYALREPDEWCPMPANDKYFDRGCFCEASSQRCLIERQTASGTEHSDCTPKITSRCQPNGQDIQKLSAEDQKSKSDEKRLQNGRWASLFGLLTISPQGKYSLTSGRPKPCVSHQDCYQLREPNEWCPLPTTDRYYEKGCFCDFSRNVCAIEREVPGGSEYTDCSEKLSSTCFRL